jgi:dihydrofolate synthase/folylpolyglutamate synthase
MPDDPTSVRRFLASLEQFGIKLGLEQIRGLLAALGNPEIHYGAIAVAGTNGKGSTAAMIERGLRAAGYRTGRYTSPHLIDVEERVAIDGQPINAAAFELSAERVRHAAARLPAPPSYFEATTAIALDAFRESHIDVAVLEVGLGGRLDATNAVDAPTVAITAIDFDHEQHLGHTLAAIAREKAGVIKAGASVVLSDNPHEADDVVAAQCRAVGATLIRAGGGVTVDAESLGGSLRLTLDTPVRRYGPLLLGLRGRHQIQNAVTATRLLETLDNNGRYRVGADAIRAGLESVVWPGRLEHRHWNGVDLVLDGAHNPAGARVLAAYLHESFGRPLPIVLGVMADKDADGIIRALAPGASVIVCTRASSPRAARPEQVAERVARTAPSLEVQVTETVATAIEHAARFGAPVVVAGSLYLVGEVRALSA